MSKDKQKYFNRLQVLFDAIVVALSYALAIYIKFISGLLESYLAIPLEEYFLAMILIVPGFLLLYRFFHMYRPRRASSKGEEVLNIIKANTAGLACIMIVLYFFKISHFSRGLVLIFYVVNMILETLARTIVRKLLRFARSKGYNRKYVLLVGYSRAAEEYIDRILSNPQWGYVVRGILDDKIESGTVYRGIKVVGRIDNLLVILPENKLDEIAITLSLEDYGRLEYIVGLCEKSGVHTKFIPDYNRVIPSRPYTEDLQGLPVINIRHVPLTNTLNIVAKRMVDIVGSICAILLFSPVMLFALIAVRLSGRGPVIFRQERIGLHNRRFMMYKFRTMAVPDKDQENRDWTVKDDPRVTRIGRILRKTSIDELPQLFNILKGDMSLVGPRPEQPQYVEQFKEQIPRYMIKHQVRPGMTGWAQISGYRGDSSIEKRIEFDLYYIENWTMGFDFKILFLTIFKGFVNKNAY